MPKEMRTTCTRDCPDSCSVIATVEDGRIIKHKGDPEHGITRGFLCSRGNNYLKRFYDPTRVLYPQFRTSSGWKRISWDEALDLTAEKLLHYKNTFGPRSIIIVNYSAIHSWLARILGRLFWAHFGGGTFITGGLSVEAAHAAQHLDFGGDCTHEPEDLVNTAGFAIWGKNVAITRQHWMPFINEARKKGAPMIVIDPVRTATAQKADRFYQIRPGSDGMLAIGVGQLLIERNDIAKDFIADHTTGFDDYRQLVFSHRLEDIARAIDLTLEQISEIADLYARKKPLATFIGLGPSYWTNGGAMVRLIDALATITGNIGLSGGGASTDIQGSAGLNLSCLREAPRGDSRRILLPKLGEEILAAKNPPIKMGWIAGANPASSAPDTNQVKKGLKSLEFLVVVEQFMSATAELADLVLPCTTYLEIDDLVTAYGHNWLSLTNRVVEPQGEAKTDGEILQSLAYRLGFGKALEGTPKVWMESMLQPFEKSGITLETLRHKPMKNPTAAPIPFPDFRFKTPSGKFEFIREFSQPAITMAQKELHLVATKTLKMVNSQILPEDLPEEPFIRVHPATLAELGFRDGNSAMVVSNAGQVTVRLASDDTVRRDVLFFNPALWKGDLSGVNQLRESLVTDLGGGAAMHQTKVTLRLLE